MELERVSSNPSRRITIVETTSLGEELVACLRLSLDFDIGQVHIGRDVLGEALARNKGRCGGGEECK